MMYATWRSWARGLILFHVVFLLLSVIVFAFSKLAYVLLAFSSLSLWTVGLVIGDLFGHRELKTRLISRGMTVISAISTTAIIGLIAATFFTQSEIFRWFENVIFWLCFFLSVLYGFLMLILYSLGNEQAQIPKYWAYCCLILGILFFLTALSTLLVPLSLILFKIVGFITILWYLVWGFWFAFLLKRLDRA